MLCPRVYPQDTHTVPRIHKQRYRPLTWECKRRFPKGDRKALWSLPQERNPPATRKIKSHRKNTRQKISIAKRGYGEKSQIPLSSILPRKSAFEKPENSPNSLPSASWCIKIGLQKRIGHACSPAVILFPDENAQADGAGESGNRIIPPQSQWRCNCPLPRRSAVHLDAGERGLGGA